MMQNEFLTTQRPGEGLRRGRAPFIRNTSFDYAAFDGGVEGDETPSIWNTSLDYVAFNGGKQSTLLLEILGFNMGVEGGQSPLMLGRLA